MRIPKALHVPFIVTSAPDRRRSHLSRDEGPLEPVPNENWQGEGDHMTTTVARPSNAARNAMLNAVAFILLPGRIHVIIIPYADKHKQSKPLSLKNDISLPVA
jgi:hypothetical protein